METTPTREKRKYCSGNKALEDKGSKRFRLPMDGEFETEESVMNPSWALQEVLRDVHASLDLLTEARNETNRLLGELITALESS